MSNNGITARPPRSQRAGRAVQSGAGVSPPPDPSVAEAPPGVKPARRSVTLPLTLTITKRGKTCTVGKLVRLGGAPTLAVVWRRQGGTQRMISLPLRALVVAEHLGAERFVLRDDRTGSALGISLAEFRKIGFIKSDGEIYLSLDRLVPEPWRHWAYADRSIDLDSTDLGQLWAGG